MQRVDLAIRSGVTCPRSMFRSGSFEAWNACLISLQGALKIISDSRFADRNGGAATCWVHWRKSGTSKQLLGLLRTAVEEAPGSALAAGCVRESTLHAGIGVIGVLFKCSQSGVLWPAMREWIVDQGVPAMWSALTWSMGLVGGNQAAHDAALRVPVHVVIGLYGAQLTFPPSAHASISEALTLLFSDILPRDLASGNVHEWCMQELLDDAFIICDRLSRSQPQPQLHRAFLVAWPHLMGWLRQQPRILNVADLMVRGIKLGFKGACSTPPLS